MNPLWATLWNSALKIPISKFSRFMEQIYGKNVKVFVFDGFFPIFQFVAFMQHCPTEGVKWSIFQRSSYFEFAHIYSKNSIEGNYLFKVNDTITKTRSVICSRFTLQTPKYLTLPFYVFICSIWTGNCRQGMPLFQIQLTITIDGEIN